MPPAIAVEIDTAVEARRLFPRPERAGMNLAWSRPRMYHSAPCGFRQRPLGPFMRSYSRFMSVIRCLQPLPATSNIVTLTPGIVSSSSACHFLTRWSGHSTIAL